MKINGVHPIANVTGYQLTWQGKLVFVKPTADWQGVAIRIPLATGATYIDAPSYSSSSTSTLIETKAGVDARTGSSSSSGAISELRVATDARTGSSSSAGSLGELRVASDARSGSSSSTASLSETRVAVDGLTGVSSSSSSISEISGRTFVDAPAGLSSSTGQASEAASGTDQPAGSSSSTMSLGEVYAPPFTPPVEPPPSGIPLELVDLLYPPKKRQGVRHDDFPVGVSHSIGSLDEVHLRAQPRATITLQTPERDDVEIVELLALELV